MKHPSILEMIEVRVAINYTNDPVALKHY